MIEYIAMVEKIIKHQDKIKKEMTSVIQRFLKDNNEKPSEVNIKVISDTKENVCIQIKIKD